MGEKRLQKKLDKKRAKMSEKSRRLPASPRQVNYLLSLLGEAGYDNGKKVRKQAVKMTSGQISDQIEKVKEEVG